MTEPPPPAPEPAAATEETAQGQEQEQHHQQEHHSLSDDTETPDPKIQIEALKFSFEMAKQVLTTAAVVLTLIMFYLRPTIEADQAVSPWLKAALVTLMASLFFGILGMGRHAANAETGAYSSGERWLALLGVAQHVLFLAHPLQLSFTIPAP
jgi:hypothetical protein